MSRASTAGKSKTGSEKKNANDFSETTEGAEFLTRDSMEDIACLSDFGLRPHSSCPVVRLP